MSKDDIICRCEEITRQEIVDCIKKGNVTLDSIKKRTRAGMGFCQGRTCARLIAQIISKETGQSIDKIKMPSRRPPIGSLTIKELAEGDK